MGFFLLSDTNDTSLQQRQQDAIIHRLGCKVCPLSRVDNEHPFMEATGAKEPLLYFLGGAPGKREDEEGRQFAGAHETLLHPHIPRKYRPLIRYNNIVQCRPPGNRPPERVEIEACRGRVVPDIEATRPKVIVGFGGAPLHWISNFSGIMLWRGRRMPVKVGSHLAWYYPMLHPSDIIKQGFDKEEIRIFGLDMERIFSELDTLPEPVVHSEADARCGVEIVTEFTMDSIRRIEVFLAGMARSGKPVGIDYETQGTRPYAANSTVLTAAVSDGDRTLSIPFDHPEADWKPRERERLQEVWVAFLTHCKGPKCAHNLSFELEWTGVKFGQALVRAGRWEDSSSQACILDERTGKMKPGPMSLEWLVQQYFGFNLKKLTKLNKNNLINEPLEEILRYNGPDAKYHLWLWQAQKARIEAEGLEYPYELALRRVPTVVLSQIRGLPVDQGEVNKLKTKYEARIAEIEAKIAADKLVARFKRETGRVFNPQSNPDVLYLFATILKRQECRITDKKSKKERASVDESVMRALASRYPLAQHILDLRKPQKLLSTYVKPMLPDSDNSVLWPDGLLHPKFNTTFVETGRLSSEEPNGQNYPKRSDEGKEVRRPIKAKDKELILSFDFGQIEARVIAMFTRDKRFLDYVWDPKTDVHMDWARIIAEAYPERLTVYGTDDPEKQMKKFRTDVKNQWTFPLFFGATAKSASRYLSIPIEVIEPLWEEFWEEFSGAADWQDRQSEFYAERGYVECLTGRRRRGPLTTNQVYNTPVQGTAAEIVLDAMSRLSETGEPLLQPELNIHDDLTFVRVPKKKLDWVVENVVTFMLDCPFEWAKVVPLAVEMAVGEDWAHMEEVAKFSSDEWLGHIRPKGV